MMTKIIQITKKITNLRDYYLVKKEPKNSQKPKPPPPPFGQCPKKNDFFDLMSSVWVPVFF